MSGNTFGTLFKLTTYGESHGPGMGGVVDGCPPGIVLNEAVIQAELDKRKPGQGPASTARKESDLVTIHSGVFEGQTTGTPIGFTIPNKDQRSRDYGNVKDVYRPGHADYTYEAKYGVRDYRGGGRASARETACRVAGGAIAQAFLVTRGVSVRAATVALDGLVVEERDFEGAMERPFFSADPTVLPAWERRVKDAKTKHDSLGGVVEVVATGVPAGLGEPVFDKLDARLAYALMGVGAVKAVEIGSGMEAARLHGSQHNDPITPEGFAANRAGGILGGVSNGEPIVVRAAVKPIPSISQEQQTVNRAGESVPLVVVGRHDVSAIPRIVPVLKAMVLLVLADAMLLQKRCF